MTGNFTDGQSIISGVTAGSITVGDLVTAAGYTQAGATIQFILNSSQVVMSKVAIGTGTGITLTFSPPPVAGEGTANYHYSNFGTLTAIPASAVAPNLMGIASFSYGVGRAALSGTVNGQGTAAYGFATTGFLANPAQGLTVRDVIQDILLLWGIEQPALAFPFLLRRAVHDLNAAMQMIWATAKDVDYFSRQTLTLTIPSNTTQISLPQNTIAALGPARLTTGQPLKVISSRSQYDSFGPIYLGLSSNSVTSGTPLAFFLERLNQANPDNVKAYLHVVPAPSQTTTLLLDVSVEAPRYQYSDYVDATPVEMFHLYADSVLLPFVRYKAMSAPYFVTPERIPALVSDYQAALRIIGAVDPALKEVNFSEHGNATEKEAP